MSTELNINALMPQEMAEKAELIGVRKAGMTFFPLFALSILAGAMVRSYKERKPDELLTVLCRQLLFGDLDHPRVFAQMK